jgi:alkylation response protein AidB-like acyl-CoA dehydrogenase
MLDAVAAAQSIGRRLEATAPHSERLRRLDDDAVAAMREAGLSRVLTPRRYGGYELPLRAQILSCAATARGCTAASWVQMVCGAHTFVVGGFPDACQKEVFGADPDVLIAGTLASQGTVERVDGGWLLDGRWQFCSGVDHSPWLLIGARQVKETEDPNRVTNAHVMVPTSDIEIDDTWYTLGMRGTGSKDIVAHRVFVPAHRAMPTGPLFLGCSPHAAGPVYRLPVLAALASMLAGTVLGMAEYGFERFVERTKARRDVYGGGSKAASAGIQRRVAEASAELGAARLLLDRICDRFDAAMAEDRPPLDVAVRARLRWDAAYVVELSRRAFDRLFAAAGAHAVYDPSELQRVHRDLHTASHHAIVDFDSVAELCGRLTLGLDPGTPVV